MYIRISFHVRSLPCSVNWLEIELKIILESICIQNTFPLKEVEKPSRPLVFGCFSSWTQGQPSAHHGSSRHIPPLVCSSRSKNHVPLLPPSFLLPFACGTVIAQQGGQNKNCHCLISRFTGEDFRMVFPLPWWRGPPLVTSFGCSQEEALVQHSCRKDRSSFPRWHALWETLSVGTWLLPKVNEIF